MKQTSNLLIRLQGSGYFHITNNVFYNYTQLSGRITRLYETHH